MMKEVAKKFDLICIGSSTASLAAASQAIKYKKSVCIVSQSTEKDLWIDKKALTRKLLYHSAKTCLDGTISGEYGVWVDKREKKSNKFLFDIRIFNKKIQDLVQASSESIGLSCSHFGIKLFKDIAKFVNPTTFKLQYNRSLIQSDKILIATEGTLRYPSINGIKGSINSILNLDSLPSSLIVVGNDSSGIEIASSLNVFGVKTGVCSDCVLPDYDSQITNLLMKHMQAKGIEFYTKAASIESDNRDQLKIKTKDGAEVEAQLVLIADGMLPNTSELDIGSVGITLGKSGEILVDANDASSIPNVFALGTVAGKNYSSSGCKVAARLLVNRLFNSKTVKVDEGNIASAVFSNPPIARCGMSESEAIAKHGKKEVQTYVEEGYQFAYALLKDKEPMMIKMITAKVSEKETVVGIQGLGKNMEEVISGLALAVKKGLKKEELERSIMIHPTLAEEFINFSN